MSNAKDMTGMRFGKLVVIERAPNHISKGGNSVVMWKCLCDCQVGKEFPNYVLRRGVELRRGHSWSCGCDVSEKLSKASVKNLVGQKYGRLTVLEYAGTKYYGKGGYPCALWKCVCDCQLELPEAQRKYTYTVTNSLTSGNTNSCGCYKNEQLLDALHKRKTQNEYKKYTGYYIGYTSKKEKFYIDETDYELVSNYKWFLDENGYVVSHTEDDFIFMHRLIMGLEKGDPREVDHIRGKRSTNDNRRINLRIAEHCENQMNRKKQRNNTSGVVGVWYEKRRDKWCAEIGAYGKRYRLGEYSTKEEATKVREEAENVLHGDYSYKNSQNYGNKVLQELERINNGS